jgi:hypothetical protein
MNIEQLATWFFAFTAAHFYQFIKTKLSLSGNAALWGLFAYALVISVGVTVFTGGFSNAPLDPMLFVSWLTAHVAPIVALATLMYKGFEQKDGKKVVPGLGISRIG